MHRVIHIIHIFIVDNVVYIVFCLNRRFVDIDKKRQIRKKYRKKL